MALHSLVLSPGSAGGRSRRISCCLPQARTVAKPLLLHVFKNLLSSEESCRELSSFPARVLPWQALIRGPFCSKASASAVWKRNGTCAIAGFSYKQATVTHKQLQDLTARAALFWKQKWSHGDSEMYQAVAKRTGLTNRPVQINSVGSHRMHGAVGKYTRICSQSSK